MRRGRGAEPLLGSRALGPVAVGPNPATRCDRQDRPTSPRRQDPPHPPAAHPGSLRQHPRHHPRAHADRPLLDAAVQATPEAIREATARKRITPKSCRKDSDSSWRPRAASSKTSCSTSSPKAASQRPDINKPLPSGYTPDFRWPEQRLILEADGAAWHDHPIARADDTTRQAHLEAQDERVIRVTWPEAKTEPVKILES